MSGLAVTEPGAGETSTEVRGSLALMFNVAGRHAGATLAADATELEDVDPRLLSAAEPQPASTSAAMAASAAPTEPVRLTAVLIRLIRLASLGVGLARSSLAVCPCGGQANFPCP